MQHESLIVIGPVINLNVVIWAELIVLHGQLHYLVQIDAFHFILSDHFLFLDKVRTLETYVINKYLIRNCAFVRRLNNPKRIWFLECSFVAD